MRHGATARLFVAVEVPEEARATLSEWARGVARERGPGGPAGEGSLRVLDPATLHLTLCFLGSRPVGEIEALGAALGPCADHACELSLGAPLWLPPRRPRMLAVEVHDPSGELARMQRELAAAIARVSDWQPDRRRFLAHITVARVRGRPERRRRAGGGRAGGEAHAGEGAPIPLLTPSLSFTPEAITLYRSTLLPSGADYEPLASSALAPA
jgi:2'-5' RNA ligase